MPVRDSTVALTQLAGQAIAEKLGFDLVALDLSAEMVLSE
ncbi:MAG: ribosome silencing factor, partial [Actinobacteria bacterium]|nr:ribosome silencing factor [Actinomycetota bacterium]